MSSQVPNKSSYQQEEQSKTSRPGRKERFRSILRGISPLMKIPLFGGFSRTIWLILAFGGFAVFLLAAILANPSPIDSPLPKRYSGAWWTAAMEINRGLQLASFGDSDLSSVAVVPLPSGKDRLIVGGKGGLLVFSDGNGGTWTRLVYDGKMGGFAISGKRAPFPDASIVPVSTPEAPASVSTTSIKPNRRSLQSTPPSPTQQSPLQLKPSVPNQKPLNAPVTRAPRPNSNSAAQKPLASLFLFPSIVPAMLASEKPPAQTRNTAAGGTSGEVKAKDAALLNVLAMDHPPAQEILAICRVADGTLALVTRSTRSGALVSKDFGNTWSARFLSTMTGPPRPSISLDDFVAGRVTGVPVQPKHLITGVPTIDGVIGDTYLTPALASPKVAFTGEATTSAFRAPDGIVWTVTKDGLYRGANPSAERFTSPGAKFNDVAFSDDGNAGFLVGEHGGVWRWQKPGNHWSPLTRGALQPELVQAASANQSDGTYWRLPPPWTYPLLLIFIVSLSIAIIISAIPRADNLMEVAMALESPVSGPQPLAGVELISVSDRPLTDDDPDVLGFGSVARGVAGFLRNPKTQLPITLAINGAWGTGKSSLMNLICSELKKAGFRPVWFNAWHHQEDENILASLLESVREEAAPSIYGAGGRAFLFRLARFRFGRYYPRALAMIGIFIGLWAAESWYDAGNAPSLRQYHDNLNETLERLSTPPPAPAAAPRTEGNSSVTSTSPQPNANAAGGNPTAGATAGAKAGTASDTAAGTSGMREKKTGPPGTGDNPPAPDKPPSQSLIVTIILFLGSLHRLLDGASDTVGTKPLAAFYLLIRIVPSALEKLKAFRTDPSSLLHSAAPGVPQKEIEAQTSFRMRFAKEFADVTKALGEKQRLVIFVDDLDRCRPTNVAEMMEAINYVTVSGECVFVLGIETEVVRAALGLSFSAIAQEIESKRIVLPAPVVVPGATNDIAFETRRTYREEFARRYTEKLINIEMSVPQLDGLRKQALLDFEKNPPLGKDPYDQARKIAKLSRALQPLVAFVLVLALGWGLGRIAAHSAEGMAHVYLERRAENEKNVVAPAKPQSANDSAGVPNPNPSPATAAPSGATPAPGAPAEKPTAPVQDVDPGQKAFPGSMIRSPGLWIVVAIAVLFLIELLAREPVPPAQDSPEFARALSAWGSIAGDGLETPRATKRFLNRLRFLAMRQHPPSAQLPGLMKLLLSAKEQEELITRDHAEIASRTLTGSIPDRILVALASLEVLPKVTGLSNAAIATAVDALASQATQSVAQGNYRCAPWLLELARIAEQSDTAVPDLRSPDDLQKYFLPFSQGGSLTGLAAGWAATAAGILSPHLPRYHEIGGEVEFT